MRRSKSRDLIAAHIGEDKPSSARAIHNSRRRISAVFGLITIGIAAQAHEAVDFIRFQGAKDQRRKSRLHYARWAIRNEGALHARPGFTPERTAARNPVMRDPVEAEAGVHVVAEPAATLLDVGNVCYETMLRLLTAPGQPHGLGSDRTPPRNLRADAGARTRSATSVAC